MFALWKVVVQYLVISNRLLMSVNSWKVKMKDTLFAVMEECKREQSNPTPYIPRVVAAPGQCAFLLRQTATRSGEVLLGWSQILWFRHWCNFYFGRVFSHNYYIQTFITVRPEYWKTSSNDWTVLEYLKCNDLILKIVLELYSKIFTYLLLLTTIQHRRQYLNKALGNYKQEKRRESFQ